MYKHWKALQASLVRSIRTKQAQEAFVAARTHHAEFEAFQTPEDLVAFLVGRSGHFETKDGLIAALVTMVQEKCHGDLAASLLWLGLWPGLSKAYQRRFTYFRAEPDELVSAISEAFTALVARLNLDRVSRVAAALVRGTERDVIVKSRRSRAKQARLDSLDELGERVAEPAVRSPDESTFGIPADLSLDDEIAALRSRLSPFAGEDTDLLVSVTVLENSLREAGDQLGLSHAAARKRFERARARVRATMAHPRSLAPSERWAQFQAARPQKLEPMKRSAETRRVIVAPRPGAGPDHVIPRADICRPRVTVRSSASALYR